MARCLPEGLVCVPGNNLKSKSSRHYAYLVPIGLKKYVYHHMPDVPLAWKESFANFNLHIRFKKTRINKVWFFLSFVLKLLLSYIPVSWFPIFILCFVCYLCDVFLLLLAIFGYSWNPSPSRPASCLPPRWSSIEGCIGRVV